MFRVRVHKVQVFARLSPKIELEKYDLVNL